MALRYLSLCSGIEAATVAWEPLGWLPVAFAEIDKFPSAVLAHHYPHVPNLGDITQISGKDFRGKIDLLVGGTPCQSFSVAGHRGGLDDPRGELTLVFLKILGEARPRWVVWENVPGVLSIDGGRTFGAILGQMAKLGYGFAYRVLDAQFFGVPQRRRRVIIVGHLGNWRPAAAVLFERHSLQRNTQTRRSQKPKTAGTSAAGTGRNRRQNDGQPLIGDPVIPPDRMNASCDSTAGSRPAYAIRTAQTSSNGWGITEGKAYTLDQAQGQCVAADNARSECFEVAPALCGGPPFSRTGNSRVECEALVTQALTAPLGEGGPDDNKAQAGFYLPVYQVFGGNNTSGSIEISPALNGHGSGSRRLDFESEAFIAQTLKGEGFDASEDGTGRANLILTAPDQPARMAFAQNSRDELRLIGGDGATAGCLSGSEGMKQRTYVASVAIRGREGGAAAEMSSDVATALRAPQGGGDKAHVLQGLAVRRLTPREAERLQGFPDGHTLIPWRGKSAEKCPDGPRYKALGNSMAVPVMRWIGERIAWVDSLMA